MAAKGGDEAVEDEEAQSENSGSNTRQSERIGEAMVEEGQAGLGASLYLEQGRVSEEEDFDGGDAELEMLLLQMKDEEFEPDPEMVKTWTESLVFDPTELFRRKFLQEYRRSTEGVR